MTFALPREAGRDDLCREMVAHWDAIERLVRKSIPVADVDDVVQETFADYCSRPTRHADEKPIAVLSTIANRRVADYHKRRNTVKRRPDDAALARAIRKVDEIDRATSHIDLERALATLTPKSRQVLVKRYVEDLPIAAIARHTGQTERAVKEMLLRAKAQLRSELLLHGYETVSGKGRGE